MTSRAFITGLAGTTITPDERSFLRAAAPWGLILFKRNVADPAQVRALTDEFRSICGRDDVPVLVDQEGGRVQRLGPPHWPAYPAGAVFGQLYARDPPSACGRAPRRRLIAADLAAVGITVDCLPLADVPVAGADRVIGDRAYGNTPDQVSRSPRRSRRPRRRRRSAGGQAPAGPWRATADSHGACRSSAPTATLSK
jgi:beta-N-acetylhexosaminidase